MRDTDLRYQRREDKSRLSLPSRPRSSPRLILAIDTRVLDSRRFFVENASGEASGVSRSVAVSKSRHRRDSRRSRARASESLGNVLGLARERDSSVRSRRRARAGAIEPRAFSVRRDPSRGPSVIHENARSASRQRNNARAAPPPPPDNIVPVSPPSGRDCRRGRAENGLRAIDQHPSGSDSRPTFEPLSRNDTARSPNDGSISLSRISMSKQGVLLYDSPRGRNGASHAK